MNKKQKSLFKLVLCAILCAVSVVLSRFFSFNVWNLSIGISFLPVMLCALICGSVWGGICGGLADLIGALLFPFGTYFPGFTAVAFFMGLIFGLVGRIFKFFEGKVIPIFVSFLLLLLAHAIGTLLLNSLWISLLYGSPYIAVLATRIPLAAAMTVLQAVCSVLICKFIIPVVNKVIK